MLLQTLIARKRTADPQSARAPSGECTVSLRQERRKAEIHRRYSRECCGLLYWKRVVVTSRAIKQKGLMPDDLLCQSDNLCLPGPALYNKNGNRLDEMLQYLTIFGVGGERRL